MDVTEFIDALVTSLDGTCMHEWSFEEGAARGSVIARHSNGRRLSIVMTATELPPSAPSEGNTDG